MIGPISFCAAMKSSICASVRAICFTLSSGDLPLAQLRWADRSGSLAHAETAADLWTLKRGGFLNPHVTLRTTDSEAALARISVHFNYHSVSFAGGAVYRFHRAGILVPAWQITTEAGAERVLNLPVLMTVPRLAITAESRQPAIT